MEPISKAVGLFFCGFLLCLGLSNAAQADNVASTTDKLKADQSDRRQGGQEAGETLMNDMERGQSIGDKTIKGEVLDIKGDNIVVKREDGKEVRLHTDETTQKARNIVPGQDIEAKVNEQNHALSILSAQAVTDRRNDKE
jgi:hypothetical protein